MTLDERLEFMAKNIESLHEAVFENTRQIAEQNRRIDERFDRVAGIIEKLADIAEIHERRLRRLEENGQPE